VRPLPQPQSSLGCANCMAAAWGARWNKAVAGRRGGGKERADVADQLGEPALVRRVDVLIRRHQLEGARGPLRLHLQVRGRSVEPDWGADPGYGG
jgi:hypothetical protein